MDKWISIDTKPEPGKEVLIYQPPSPYSGEGAEGVMAVSYYIGESPYDFWPDGQDEQPGSYSPSHWMPLPEPPQ